jgi:hypothetical protein
LRSAITEQNTGTIDLSPPDLASAAGNAVLELAGWTAGLDSFLSSAGDAFGDRAAQSAGTDLIRDLRLSHNVLQRCSRLVLQVSLADDALLPEYRLSMEELLEFGAALREPLLLAESLQSSDSLGLAEWQAWCRVFIDRLASVPAYTKLVALTESGGNELLPEVLQRTVLGSNGAERPEFAVILPRFGRILRLLDIVGRMLAADEPLKPTLVLFSRINEMTLELIAHLNHRVERSGDADDEFTAAIDGASYMASIELKKVVQLELSGLTSVRPATSVYARIEAAHAVLTESFQHILTGFARHFEPAADAMELFPNFEVKLRRSLKLRKDLYDIMKLAQRAEREPEAANVAALNSALETYLEEAVSFLFYKDKETFERFAEEIIVTKEKKDLVPILHRFGAYVETLFAQVNMRAVLEKHPFEVPKS